MSSGLQGEVALVTGSGRGLGRAMADRLAELGASVAIHDIDADAPAEFDEAAHLDQVVDAIGEHGTAVTGVTGDVTDERAVALMVEEAESALGPISILVTAAGGDISIHGGKPEPNNAVDMAPEEVRGMLDRNLLGTIFTCQAVCGGMRDRGRGSVVCIASAAAHVGCPEGSIYAVAKAGVVHYVRCLAAQVQPFGVRVNAVSPGGTVTGRYLATREVDEGQLDPEAPCVSRVGRPEEIADVVAFLVGQDARYVSGKVIGVDGGRLLWPE